MESIEHILESTNQSDNTDDVVSIVETLRSEGVEADEIGSRLSLLKFDSANRSEDEVIKTAKRLENPKMTTDQLEVWYRKTYQGDEELDDDDDKTLKSIQRQEAAKKAMEFIETKRPKPKAQVDSWNGIMSQVLPQFNSIVHEIRNGEAVERSIKVDIPEGDISLLSSVAEDYLRQNNKPRTKESVIEAVEFAQGLYMAQHWRAVLEKNIRDVSADIEERIRKEYANTGEVYRPLSEPDRAKVKSDMEELKRAYFNNR